MTVFYAWELGANLGHITRWRPIETALQQRGIKTVAALRIPIPAGQPPLASVTLHSPHTVLGPATPETFTDILSMAGWDNFSTLLALVDHWRRFFIEYQAKLILPDFAPTAILAAKTLGLKTINCGQPFYSPPAVAPFPPLRPWQPIPAEVLAVKNEQVLGVVNRLLLYYKCPTVSTLYDALKCTDDRLFGLPGLDCYQRHNPPEYWGMLPPPTAHTIAWPQGKGPRVFCYLPADHRLSLVILDALAQSGFPCLVFTPHPLPIANIPRHLKISHDMLDLGIIAKQADLAIAVSITTASHFLLRGKPVLCAPTQLEQYLHARAVVEELRAGMMLLPDAPVSSQQIISALHSMYHHPSFAQNARNFRQRNPNPYNGLKRFTVAVCQYYQSHAEVI